MPRQLPPHTRGYALVAKVTNPSKSLWEKLGGLSWTPRQSHKRQEIIMCLARQDGNPFWEPLTVEHETGPEDLRMAQTQYVIPPELREEECTIVYTLEAKEIGAVRGTDDNAFVKYAQVVGEVSGDPRFPYYMADYESPHDWHRCVGGFAAPKLGRVSLINHTQLYIDETYMSAPRNATSINVQSNIILDGMIVDPGGYAPQLEEGLERWQAATNGLFERLGCRGCSYLHFRRY